MLDDLLGDAFIVDVYGKNYGSHQAQRGVNYICRQQQESPLSVNPYFGKSIGGSMTPLIALKYRYMGH